ncbi:OmpA family protein [Paracoccus tibetensis]|uniref:Outer membrane protein OmpA n=1 Tax=Paracoccus tibetensis TaxID=336292 RepID=A0A1G5J2Y6_9RHOB|nr:OmpA family protein [Paracoccus tibetensis]SCY82199.1 Outer membrane protein OmpA [Paracoccus tibetensis]
MRRIIHNSTAIAACLSLLAPHLAHAELRIPDAEVEGRIAAQAEQRPADDAALQAELATGLQADDLECADGGERPCADDVALLTPGGLEVDLSDSGQIVLANVTVPAATAEAEPEDGPQDGADLNMQETEAEPEADSAEELTAADALADEPVTAQSEELGDAASVSDLEAALAAEADGSADVEAEAEIAETETVEPEPAEPAVTAAEEAPLPEADTAETDTAEAPATEPAAETAAAEDAAEADALATDAAPEAEATDTETDTAADAPADDSSLVDSLARALAGQDDAADAPAAEADATATADASAEGSIDLSTDTQQQERAAAQPELAQVLSEEAAAGLSLAALTAAGNRFLTPRGVVIEESEQGVFRLAAPEAQMYRVEDGQMVLRAAEEDTRETEVAREAAEASEPVSAAALEAEEGSGEVTEQQVTEENSRSSSEDFTSSLRDALATAVTQGQQQARDAQAEAQAQAQPQAQSGGSGSSNDLTRALLLGLGAVAVGSMLNNNRQVALSAPDRIVVTRPDGSQEVIRDDVALLRQPGSTVTTENFDDGSSRTIVTRADGSRVITIRDANLNVLRRTLVSADGTQTRLIDDTADVRPVDVTTLPAPAPVPAQRGLNEDELRVALQRETVTDRQFTLSQIRNIPEVRALVAPVNIEAITFDTGSAALRPDQAQQLASLGRIIQEQVRANPREIFMIEGHTDTVGSEAYNLALSDRRAESVALALTEYFQVPPENLVTQGYGEQFLLVRAEGDIRENRRASVRRITDLLAQAQ